MANIKVLTPDIYNKIAAGEVVERPFGAVKELVENSIDAGATRIDIEVVNGGFDLISVTDNGCGIREDDVELAFIKHATSKLNSVEHLAAIDTLGFRGEALSSIAAVARVTLTTRTSLSDTGINVYIEDGKTQSKQYVPFNVGTKIEVRDLFYNTPARKKFFKSSAAEAAEITKFVSKLILTNPTREINYVLDGKAVYSVKGMGLDEAIFKVYGSEYLNNCIKIDYHRDALHIEGYIGSPEYAKANRNYQTLSVNDRYVSDQSVSAAIMQAYKPYLMTRQFPVYVLNLMIPCDLVDVNVHPKKSEVRFADTRNVCGAFYRAITNALQQFSMDRVDQTFTELSPSEIKTHVKYAQEELTSVINKLYEQNEIEIMNRDQTAAVEAMEQSTELADKRKSLRELGEILEREISVEKARVNLGLDKQPAVVMQPTAAVNAEAQPKPYVPSQEDMLFQRAKILGAAFKTYLILELDDKLIFVDQHAAHERILFDKFMENKTQDMQAVMFPFVFSVSDEEAAFIDENRANILSAGIEIEEFGHNTYRITAVSTLLEDMEMQDFVRFLLSSIDEFKLDDRTLIVEKVAKKACKAAVKAGYALNEYEIKYILKEVCENKILQCPHGRPITVVFGKTQLEKMFKRIV